MEARISFITLGVADLERATRFYADGLGLPQLGAPPNAAFFDFGIFRLALYPPLAGRRSRDSCGSVRVPWYSAEAVPEERLPA